MGGSTRIDDRAIPCPAQPWIHPSTGKIHMRSELFILQRSPRTWSLWVRTTRKKKKCGIFYLRLREGADFVGQSPGSPEERELNPWAIPMA